MITKKALLFYGIAAVAIIFIDPAAQWFADLVGVWIGVER